MWKLGLNQADSELQLLERTLARDERARAAHYHFERDRNRFIAARGQLRMLSRQLPGSHPSVLEFSYEPRGKPAIRRTVRDQPVKFNLSHSGALALVAVALEREVGVDLEEIHELSDFESIAERFFSLRENAVLRSLSERERLAAFFHCWTSKEAYIKATGDGLALPTESFDVAFWRGDSMRLLRVEGKSEEPSRWSFMGLAPEHGHVGALAAAGSGWSVACWHFTPTTHGRFKAKPLRMRR